MSNKNNVSARGVHVSPGVYSKEVDINYAVKSLGITTLGVVGETLKGPAFQPMAIENWRDFTSTFGGTSTEKFKGSKYPKYELPYIAKSYLSESNQLQVCRVLGLSGYNAGPAWVITASVKDNTEKHVVAVLRSRGKYEYYKKYEGNNCNCPDTATDVLTYDVDINNDTLDCTKPKEFNNNVKLSRYTNINFSQSDCNNSSKLGQEDPQEGNGISSSTLGNPGKFNIEISLNSENKITYSVSLNPGDKDYILNVLGTNPHDGDAILYVESLYDYALEELISENVGKVYINKDLEFYQPYNLFDYVKYEPVNDFLTKDCTKLTRKDVGKRFLADTDKVVIKKKENEETNNTTSTIGSIYVVKQVSDNGVREYKYEQVVLDKNKKEDGTEENVIKLTPKNVIQVLSTNSYWLFNGSTFVKITCDLNNYKSAYRFASTPWFVSNVKGDYNNIKLDKLFRFHTISDGSNSHLEVKISIENIRPDEGTFDVVVRDFNDSDANVVVLEKYSRCTLVPGDNNYIAYKIGSYDGIYEAKSKYVTVEVSENESVRNSVPCGFLGYPMIDFGGQTIQTEDHGTVVSPTFKYNKIYDEDIKSRKQYFGLSDMTGVDVDMLSFKGVTAYKQNKLTNGFHLDCRLNEESYSVKGHKLNITVDGDSETPYTFDTVSASNTTNMYNSAPIISTEADMADTIYAMPNLRKFTAYFYGGFDGWDIYRDSRTNTDEYKMTKYKGQYNDANGIGSYFDRIQDGESLGLNQKGITSDWYAYLAGIRQFANPESVDINLFATPGIDLVNNKTLVDEVIEMIEEERADSLYVATMPDKPFGAEDYVDEMYTSDDVVAELEATDIDSNYTCTYYPWIKYHDRDNNQYIYLPPTKDVVRNMALTDNTAHPWFVPAGLTRGDVDCVNAHYVTKLADEDVLYEGRINPIKTFASDGVKIWGQKNLQVNESQLNRVSVRRLLLRMRKLIAIACLQLIFEPNDNTTKQKFLSIVTPILDNIRSNRGISDYRIEVDDSVEAHDRRELPAKIYFKPYNALEYITLDFVLTPQSSYFTNI